MNVTAKVRRSGDWWAIEVPEVPGVFTQAKRLDQVPAMVADAVALMVDGVPVADVTVTLDVQLPEDLRHDVVVVLELNHQVAKLSQESSALMRKVACDLRSNEKLTVRDVGALLDVSPQRVSQLVATSPSAQ